MLDPKPIDKARKKPVQARSTQTVSLLLEAAAQVLEANGELALTTKTVAERAGFSIGTLYQYFPNRDAILVPFVIDSAAKCWIDALAATEPLRDQERDCPEVHCETER